MFKTIRYLVILCCPFFVFAQPDPVQIAEKSVVKIVIQSGNMTTTGTGWSWKNPNDLNNRLYVVTALHVVAGHQNNRIQIWWGKNKPREKSTTASIIKVYREADLALLQLHNDIGLVPLETKYVNPNLMENGVYRVWGYPRGVSMIEGKRLGFSLSTQEKPTLNSIIASSDVVDQLDDQGYPKVTAQIYRIHGTLRKGISGGPIISSDGKVVGIADGGLNQGISGLNWGFPAHVYVPQLIASNESFPTRVSAQSTRDASVLMSNQTMVSENASSADIEAVLIREEELSTVSSGTGKEIHKTWVATLGDIYATANQENKIAINNILESGLIGLNSSFDVYEDYDTGATFAVPSGYNVTFQDEYFMAISESGLAFAFVPIQASSFAEAKYSVDAFIQGVISEYPGFRKSINFEDGYEINEYSENLIKTVFREVDWQGGQYLISLEGRVDGSNLACLYLDTKLPREMNQNQLREFFLFALASELVSFSSY